MFVCVDKNGGFRFVVYCHFEWVDLFLFLVLFVTFLVWLFFSKFLKIFPLNFLINLSLCLLTLWTLWFLSVWLFLTVKILPETGKHFIRELAFFQELMMLFFAFVFELFLLKIFLVRIDRTVFVRGWSHYVWYLRRLNLIDEWNFWFRISDWSLN